MNKSKSSISQWHIFISGYTQNRQQSTGLQQAWLQAQTNDSISNASTCFFPVLPWNYDWYTLSRFIQINSQTLGGLAELTTKPPLINIYAYSWGAGWGAMQLASDLNKVANYDVQNMVLADPVACAGFAGWRAVFASRIPLFRRFAPTITIPANVLSVYWSRQFNNWPRAHSLVKSSNSKTIINPPNLEINLIHAEMDESTWFQSKVQELCNG